MKIYSAQLKGTTTVATGSNVSLTGSFSGSIAGIDINATNQFTASTSTRLTNIEIISASNINRITSLETKSASVDISISNINAVTSSFSPRVLNLESKSASVDISISNINVVTASNIARLSNLETKSSSVDISVSSINSKTGSYATTGSNTFFGTQTYSGSVYIANDLIVQGSSSIQYISASSVSIGTNIVQLNTANPSVRFAGLTIIDSGSIGGSGSFLYDSVHDEFVFVHRGNGTNVTSSHFVLGPETYDSLGNETYLTTNILTKGTGKEHLVDSCIFDNGTTTCIKNNLIGTGTACFASNVCTPTIVVNNTNPVLYINSGNNETATIGFTQGAVTGYGGFIKVGTGLGDRSMTFGLSAAGTNNDACTLLRLDDSGVVCFNNAICAPRAELTSDASCVPLRLINGVITGGSTTGVTALYFGDAGSGVSMLQREKYTVNQANLVLYSEYGYNTQSINACLGYNGVAFYTAGTKRQSIDGSGITCFSNTVCVGGELLVNGSTININCTNTTATDARINLYTRSTTNGDRASIYTYNLSATTAGCEITYLAFGYCCTNNKGYINMQTKSGGAWCNTMYLINGRVGIGTTIPYVKLDVRGEGIGQTTTDFVASSAGTVIYMRTGATTGNTTYGLIQVGNTGDTTGGNLILNQYGGNVGIGTTSPSYALEICSNVTDWASRIYNSNGAGNGLLVRTNNTCTNTTAFGVYNGTQYTMAVLGSGVTNFVCQVCTPVLRASRVISNSTQIYDGDFSLNAGNTRSVVLCGGIYTLGDFHLMTYGNAGTGMSTIRLSTAGYFANTSLLQFCELQRYTFGSMTISGVSNNGTSISFNIGNCSGGSNGTGFFRMISLNGDAENNCIRVFIL